MLSSSNNPRTSPLAASERTSIKNQVGLIGLGLMGCAMAERFLARGIHVMGFDIDSECVAKLVNQGGGACASVAQLAEMCDRIILSLPNSDVVQSVLKGLESNLRSGQLIIDTTTGRPEAATDAARRLLEHGVMYVEAMISGNSSQLRDGNGFLEV